MLLYKHRHHFFCKKLWLFTCKELVKKNISVKQYFFCKSWGESLLCYTIKGGTSCQGKIIVQISRGGELLQKCPMHVSKNLSWPFVIHALWRRKAWTILQYKLSAFSVMRMCKVTREYFTSVHKCNFTSWLLWPTTIIYDHYHSIY